MVAGTLGAYGSGRHRRGGALPTAPLLRDYVLDRAATDRSDEIARAAVEDEDELIVLFHRRPEGATAER
jgi:hypothetical protein